MKNALVIALFAAATVGASAQYDNGSSAGGTGAHTVGGASGITHTSMDDPNNGGYSKATATIRTEVVENVTVSYLNTPIDIVGNVGYGTSTPAPNEVNDGATPAFFLIENESAEFNNFKFQVRGSENATVQLDWSVDPTGTSVALTEASAVMTVYDATDVDPSSGIAFTNNYSQSDNTADVGTGAMGGTFSNAASYGASGGHAPGATTPNTGAAGEPWFGGNHYDETGPIDFKISFKVKALTEGPGVGTTFEVSLKATNYTLLGDVASI